MFCITEPNLLYFQTIFFQLALEGNIYVSRIKIIAQPERVPVRRSRPRIAEALSDTCCS